MMMKDRFVYILLIFLVLSSCTKHSEKFQKKDFKPDVIEAKGLVVCLDSMPQPKEFTIGVPVKISAGNPEVIPVDPNVHPAGIPHIITAGSPTIQTPGLNGFSVPKVIKAVDSPCLAEIPVIVEAEKATIKEQNPFSFSTFSKLQGLNDNAVRCILSDYKGNIWFGTDGGGVSKYDGRFFTNYTSREGLSNNTIRCMLQDKNGNLWFGTDGGGVTKFDGKYFTHYTEQEGISNDRVFSALEDSKGILWFGTYGGGVSKYDGKSFTHYTIKEGLCHNVIRSILEDKQGNIWLGSDGGGVSRFDGKSFANYTVNEGLGSNFIWSMILDTNGKIWFGEYGNGASLFDGKSFTRFTAKEGLASNNVYCMKKDKQGNIWFGTYGEGVLKFDGNNFTHFSEKEGLSNNFVFTVFQDINDNIWIGTDGGGVSMFRGELFTHFSAEGKPSNNYIVNVLKDKDNNIWFATDGNGVLKYDGEKFLHFTEKEGLISDVAMCLMQDKTGRIWIFTYRFGVTIYDGKHFFHFSGTGSVSDNMILSAIQDKNGTMWFGTNGNGLLKYDGKSLLNYTKKEGFCNSRIIKIVEDRTGNLWFGTMGSGIIKFDGKRFTHYTKNEGLNNNNILTIFEDKSGNIWFGTDGGGALKYDGNRIETIEKNNNPSSYDQYDLVKANGKFIKTFTVFAKNEGLTDNIVKNIIEDINGNLWFGTHKGLSKLTKDKLKSYYKRLKLYADSPDSLQNHLPLILFKNFTYEDGFLGIGCSRNAICEDKNGTIWIGANAKLTAYHSEGDKLDTIPPNIQLLSVNLYNENVHWIKFENKSDTSFVLKNGITVKNFSFDSTTKWYGLPMNLCLRHNNNFITFKYIGIKLTQSDKVMYQYKLDGLENNWNAYTISNEVSYGNLPAGKYTFKVKAMNSDGYWSKVYSYSFTIIPPWWKTWLFRIFVIVIILISTISIFRWRISLLKRKEKQLEKLVRAKTAEVVSQNTAITEQNLILEKQKTEIQDQRNELEAANAAKDRFFSIIAHDLRSPISGFLGLTEVLTNELPNNDPGKILRLVSAMRKSSTNIFNLLENLLSWGRMQQGLYNFVMNYIELFPVIEECISTTIESAKNKGIEIQNNTPAGLLVYADVNVLKMVIRNLLTNAVKFSNMGAKVTVSARNTIDYNVEICVKDSGIGMNDTLLNNLFRIDLQTNRRGTDGEPSTGLGLIICKELIEKHNGKLTVQSKVAQGSVFCILLPLNPENPDNKKLS